MNLLEGSLISLMKEIPVRHINSGIKEPDASGKFIVQNLRELLAESDMVQELHRHSFYFILILEKGAGMHSIDFIPQPMVDQSIFFMRPGQVHELMLKQDSNGYLVQFPNDFYFQADNITKQLLRKVGQKNYYLPDSESSKTILSLMNMIVQEASDKKERYDHAVRAYLQLFFIEVLRANHSSIEIPENQNTYDQERFAAFQELIADNISTHKHVIWYAEKLHLTPYQLNAVTKSTVGKTSSAIITEHILLEAKRYLLATSNQINQISGLLGYEDVSYFIRFFKKHTGHSPEAFRNNFK